MIAEIERPHMSQETFMAYCNKRFKAGDIVMVHDMGPTMPRPLAAEIVGIYSFCPHESYIVRWLDFVECDSIYVLYSPEWPCCVITKACLTHYQEYLNARQSA